MQLERLAELFSFYRFSLGSLGYILDNTGERLEELGFEEGVEMVETAKAAQQRALELQYAWKQNKKKEPLQRHGAKRLDNQIDETLSAMLQAMEAFANLPEGSDKCGCAEQLVDELFPEGVYPITSETFNNQHAHVERLVEQLTGEYADQIETLGLEEMVQNLEELNTEFGERLEPEADGVEYDEVQAAHTEAEDAFHRVVAVIVGEYADDLETLNELLAPVFEQTERTRRHMKRRGTIPEVDPETGEPVEPTDGEPTDGEPTDGEPVEPSDGEGDGEPTDGDSSSN